MTRNPLTNLQKAAIQGLLFSETPINEIAKQVGRQKKIVQKYIDEELNDIYDTITKIQAGDTEELTEEITEEITEEEEIEIKTKEALRQERVDKAVQQALEQTPKTKKLSKVRKRKEEANKGIIGKEKGVAIMTEAGSEISDAIEKHQRANKTISRTARGNIYRINEEEIT